MNTHDTNNEPANPDRGGAIDPLAIDIESEDRMEQEIDRDSDDSFPASDPPGWVMGTESGYRPHSVKSPSEKPVAKTETLAEHSEGSPSDDPADKPIS